MHKHIKFCTPSHEGLGKSTAKYCIAGNFHEAVIFAIKHHKNLFLQKFLADKLRKLSTVCLSHRELGELGLHWPEALIQQKSLHNPCNSCILVPCGSCVWALFFQLSTDSLEYMQTLSTLSGLRLLKEDIPCAHPWGQSDNPGSTSRFCIHPFQFPVINFTCCTKVHQVRLQAVP